MCPTLQPIISVLFLIVQEQRTLMTITSWWGHWSVQLSTMPKFSDCMENKFSSSYHPLYLCQDTWFFLPLCDASSFHLFGTFVCYPHPFLQACHSFWLAMRCLKRQISCVSESVEQDAGLCLENVLL